MHMWLCGYAHVLNHRENVGCDVRAACTEPVPGDVHCSCKQSNLIAATDFGELVKLDGSLCIQPPSFDVAATTKHIRIEVLKPVDSATKPFQVAAKGDSSFHVSMHVIYGQPASNYLLIIDEQQKTLSSGIVHMGLSRAKSEGFRPFFLRAIGNHTPWADKDERSATVRVSYDHSAQDMTVSVRLKPYPSCTHTQARLSAANEDMPRAQSLQHLDGLSAILMPRDTDNLSITQTEFNFALYLKHEAGKSIKIDTKKASSTTTVRISHLETPWQGLYTLTTELLDGWDHEMQTLNRCITANMTFFVSCSAGYHPADSSNRCVSDNFAQVCKHAQVMLGSEVLSDGGEGVMEAMIAEDGQLSVLIRNRTGVHVLTGTMAVRLTPVKGTIEGKITRNGRFDTKISKTGKFDVYIGTEDRSASCLVNSTLAVKCRDGYELKDSACIDKSKAKLNIILGACIGMVLVAVVVYFAYICRQTCHGLTMCTMTAHAAWLDLIMAAYL